MVCKIPYDTEPRYIFITQMSNIFKNMINKSKDIDPLTRSPWEMWL